jgi:hypothetical protein
MKNSSGDTWIRRYYLLTPLFIMLDALFGFNFRVSGLASPELRYLLLWTLPAVRPGMLLAESLQRPDRHSGKQR